MPVAALVAHPAGPADPVDPALYSARSSAISRYGHEVKPAPQDRLTIH